MKLVIAGIACAVALAAPAGVASAEHRTTYQEILDFARTQWPQSPCAGRDAWTALPDDYAIDDAEGFAYQDDSCRWSSKTVVTAEFPVLRCVIAVHELGHLAGLVHEDAARFPVMAQGWVWYRPCVDRFFASQLYDEAMDVVNAKQCVELRRRDYVIVWRCRTSYRRFKVVTRFFSSGVTEYSAKRIPKKRK